MKNYGHARTNSGMPLLPYVDQAPPRSPLPDLKGGSRAMKFVSYRRRPIFMLCAIFSMLFLAGLTSWTISGSSRSTLVDQSSQSAPLPEDLIPLPVLNETVPEVLNEVEQYSPYVVGAPTASFRDNLRNDTKYITSWLSAGWNNDVMTYMNLIYLAKVADRVPVVAMFTPSHINIGGTGAPASVITFGEIFDVPRFIKESGLPLLEWLEVKDPQSDVVDDIGCWNVWETVQYYEHMPRGSTVPHHLRLDISYTRGPDWLKLIPNFEHDKCSTFDTLARLAYPEDRAKSLGNNVLPSPLHQVTLDPDEHMLCYDYLYYACASQSFEFDYEYSPVWRYVGKYMYWTDEVKKIATQYVNRVFGLPEDGAMPDYITIHVRHGDFGDWCWEAETPEDCFAPLPVIARRVREVQDELRERKGIDVPMSRVIMTSDEKDPAWWDEVTAMGWVKMDHDAFNTVEMYGRWFPVILDAAIQSLGQGFVGTDRSTFSILSRRRVLDWHNGAARMVLWGKKGADDH